MTPSFGYSIVYVADVMATVSFYEAAFGLKRKFVHDGKLYAEMETGQTTLAFAGEAMAEMNGFAIRANRRTDLAPGFELALIFADPHDAYRKAVAAGASRVKPPEEKPWGQIVGYVRDINGCLIEIASAVRS